MVAHLATTNKKCETFKKILLQYVCDYFYVEELQYGLT